MTLAEILEKLLVSMTPVQEGTNYYVFYFPAGENSTNLYMYVSRDYSNSEHGEWVIEEVAYLY